MPEDKPGARIDYVPVCEQRAAERTLMSTGDRFDDILNHYTHQWLDALDLLFREEHYFAAAGLACLCLDHLGNALRQESSAGGHKSAYLDFIRKYLGPDYQCAEAFPNDEDMRVRFYEALRCGLVHEARTDDHQKERGDAAPVMISHEDFRHERSPWNDVMYVSVQWLVRCVKRAWERQRSICDSATRSRVAERLQLFVHEGTGPLPEVSAGADSIQSRAASGTGSNFSPPSQLPTDDAF